MSARLRITSALRWCGAAALVFAVQAAHPADVLASCGDWLAGHANEPAAAATSRTVDADSAPADSRQAAEAESPTAPVDGPLPCQGAGCRRAPEAPAPSAPPSTLADGQDRWFHLAAELPALSAGARRLAFDATQDVPAGFRPRVDRPPRV